MVYAVHSSNSRVASSLNLIGLKAPKSTDWALFSFLVLGISNQPICHFVHTVVAKRPLCERNDRFPGLFIYAQLYYPLRKTSISPLNSPPLSNGKMGRRQRVCPRRCRLALVEPSTSVLSMCRAQPANMWRWQWGDLTMTASKCLGSCPCA